MKLRGQLLVYISGVIIALLSSYHAVCSTSLPPARNFAVLVANSNGWLNYRHQADVCHSYQVLLKNGFDPNNIIVFLYDDVAWSPQNSFPGKLFNDINGPDVYQGVIKDYTSQNVNVDVLQNVLLGQDPKVGTRRYLESGPTDNVFLYFAGHGMYERMCFPNDPYGNSMGVSTSQLTEILYGMKRMNKFDKMVIYTEACNSASLFNATALQSINVYAMTAANATQWSFACNMDPQLKAWLGDYFSVRWMYDSETNDPLNETIEAQFARVKSEVFLSEVCQIGEMEVADSIIQAFQGGDNVRPTEFSRVTSQEPKYQSNQGYKLDSIPADQVEEYILNLRMTQSTTFEEKLILAKELEQLKTRQHIHQTFYEEVVANMNKPPTPVGKATSVENSLEAGNKCRTAVVDKFEETCSSPCGMPQAASLVNKLVLLCDATGGSPGVVDAVAMSCAKFKNKLRIV